MSLNKRGLTPKEFQDSLTSKVDSLLALTKLQRIKTLKNKAIEKVKKNVCIRENETRPHTDQRLKGVQNYVSEGIFRDSQDTPMKRKKDSGGQQGRKRVDRTWKNEYHKEQDYLFETIVGDTLRVYFPKIENRGGYLYHQSSTGKPLPSTEFCQVIDKITAELCEELSRLRRKGQDAPYNSHWQPKLNSVSNSCKKILIRRMAMDWCTDNDLMVKKDNEIWRDHVEVIISFAALMVVAEMIIIDTRDTRDNVRIIIDTRDNVQLSTANWFLFIIFVVCYLHYFYSIISSLASKLHLS